MTSPELRLEDAAARPGGATRPGRLARAWAGLRFRDAVALSLIPLLAALMLAGLAIYDYARARQFDDWWSNAQTVNGYFDARAHAAVRLPAAWAIRNHLDPARPDAGVIRIEVPAAQWDAMWADPLAMWGTWVDGTLRYGKSMVPVKLRKRGDNSIHWLTDKRSFTVRTPREEFYKRFRSFGLSAKDVLASYTANRLTDQFGLLAGETEVVPVYLNNKFHGLYRFVEPIDESFLRPFDRMPGNIFRADAAERGEVFKGSQRVVFENPYIWDRVANNDRWTSAGGGQLALLLNDLAGTTFADHQRLMQRVDRDEWARMFTYLFVVGDPFHMDRVHNELVYEDPTTQQLHPIPWDIRLLALGRLRQPLNNWMQGMLRDPFVVDATMRELATRVADDRLLHAAESLATTAERRYAEEFRYDRLRRGLIPDVWEAGAVGTILRGNVAQLRRWVDSAVVAVHVGARPEGAVLDLVSEGFAGATLTGFTVTGPVGGAPRLRLDSDLDGLPSAGDRVLPLVVDHGRDTTRLVLREPVALLSALTGNRGVEPGRLSYRMFLEGAGATATPVLANRLTGGAVHVLPLADGAVLPADDAWHPWRFPATPGRVLRLSGQVRLDSTLKVPAGDTVIIAPGTDLRLGPDVSFLSRGVVLAEGTAERPIRVLPAVAGTVWGTFSLQDHGADGSIFRHVVFAEGGGALIDRVEYIGMVNTHRVDRVLFEEVTFRDNKRSDDTFHALHSHVTVRRSHFLRANSDALDMDISTGELYDNTFEDTGGDALDLMSSTPRIVGNRILRSGDKGISVGEASTPFVFNNYIEGCTIGIEVKDRSAPVILQNELVRNKTGLRERRKNWRYGGGGWATVARTAWTDSRKRWVQDPFSRITLVDVVGLDTLPADTTGNGDLSWLYAAHGVEVEGTPAPGRVTSWREVPPLVPVDEGTFADDFGAMSDGWVPAEGTRRLEKRRDALVMEVERTPGTATKPVRWDLPQGGTLVLEAAGETMAGARVMVTGADGTVHQAPIRIGPEAHQSRFTELELPPGQYVAVAVELTPVPGLTEIDGATGLRILVGARLDLRRYAVYPTR